MLTVHHLASSQSERIVWLCEELELPYTLAGQSASDGRSQRALKMIEDRLGPRLGQRPGCRRATAKAEPNRPALTE